MKLSQQTIIGFLIGIFIGGFALYLAAELKNRRETASGTPSPSKGIFTATLGSNTGAGPDEVLAYAVRVYDQPAGFTVEVRADLTADSWLAVHDDVDKAAGRILGAGWFKAGAASGTIPLVRATLPDTTYHVLIYTDNGNKQFEYRIDPVVLDSNNLPAMGTFHTTLGGASR